MTLCLGVKMTFEIPGNDNNYNLNVGDKKAEFKILKEVIGIKMDRINLSKKL